jgi:hypothetical protein
MKKVKPLILQCFEGSRCPKFAARFQVYFAATETSNPHIALNPIMCQLIVCLCLANQQRQDLHMTTENRHASPLNISSLALLSISSVSIETL